jgi:predicted Co/Zn/Cd cation transporter (cation efflux family)
MDACPVTPVDFRCYLLIKVIRIILIIGAAACVVIGGKMVAQDIVYQVNTDPIDLFITIFPFVPIILMAPRYKNGRIIYGFIAVVEILIIVMNYFLVLR